ncbi:MFS transporter [Ensifer aridi]|uniref:MFS transporter n=1 Tax=Ensifer aridi TaxID=1708715 RepID=UPI0009C0843F|nr:MFS transporter [Ensifer aridi]
MRTLLTPWRSVAAGFLLNGVLLGTWASRVPAVMAHFHFDKASFGGMLVLLGLGALFSFPIAGRLSDSLGAVRVARMIAIPFLLSIAFLGLAPTIPLLTIALFLFGMCHGSMDVAMNSWASEVEKHMRRSVMSSFHAMWSVGAVLGAASGYVATAFQTPVYIHFLVSAVVTGGTIAPFLLLNWQSTKRTHVIRAAGLAVPNSALLLVGLIALASGLGEGTALDWSAVYLHDVVGTAQSDATLGYTGFSAAMVIARLNADSLVTRFGSATVARLSGLSAVFGILLIVGDDNLPLVVVGFVLMGVGYAAVLPLAFSRAAADPVVPAGKGIASVAIFAYGAMTLGPVVIGILAEATTMRVCFLMVGLFAASIAVLAPVLEQRP